MEITAGHAAQLLEAITPSGAVETARCELAAEFPGDLRHVDAQMRDTKKKITTAVRASGTTLTEIFGVGPVIAATVIGCARDVARFPDRDHFAAYNGTAPIEVSSGNRKIYRLSRRGNRRLNHAIHMAAVTQIRYHHSDGRAYYDKKLAEGKTRERPSGLSSAGSATPSSPASSKTPGRPAHSRAESGPGGQRGATVASAAGLHPGTSSSAKPPPDVSQHYGPLTSESGRKTPSQWPPNMEAFREPLDTKRLRSERVWPLAMWG